MRILLVEDDEEMAGALVEALTDENYAVDLARTGTQADDLMSAHPYDLVVLDRHIPPPTGLELLRTWREAGVATPVLVLTGDGSVRDKIEGLDLGADDYLVKPFAFAELYARLRSLLRRREKPLVDRLAAGDIVLDRAKHEATVAGEPVHLAPKEFALLEYLLLNKDQVVSRSELVEHVWDERFDPDSNVIDVLIHRLRAKIDRGRDEKLLHTVVAAGYVLTSERCREA